MSALFLLRRLESRFQNSLNVRLEHGKFLFPNFNVHKIDLEDIGTNKNSNNSVVDRENFTFKQYIELQVSRLQKQSQMIEPIILCRSVDGTISCGMHNKMNRCCGWTPTPITSTARSVSSINWNQSINNTILIHYPRENISRWPNFVYLALKYFSSKNMNQIIISLILINIISNLVKYLIAGNMLCLRITGKYLFKLLSSKKKELSLSMNPS